MTHLRTLCITAAFCAALVFSINMNHARADAGALSSNMNNNSANERFTVYEQFNYNDVAEMRIKFSHYGLQHIPLLTSYFFFPGSVHTEEITDEVRAHITHMAQTRMVDGNEYILDIEHWRTDVNISNEERAANVEKYVEVIRIIESVHPNVKLGYYAMIPSRNYWDVYENCAYNDSRREECLANEQAWRDANTQLLPLAMAVDTIYPSLYTFYDNPEGWAHYALANIEEAERLATLAGGKPVIAYLWPRYHDSTDMAYQLIDEAYWRLQLEVVKSTNADGLIIWDNAPHRSTGEMMRDPWFVQTFDFIRRLGDDDTNDVDEPDQQPRQKLKTGRAQFGRR